MDVGWRPALWQARQGTKSVLAREIAPTSREQENVFHNLRWLCTCSCLNPPSGPVNTYLLLSHFTVEETEAR